MQIYAALQSLLLLHIDAPFATWWNVLNDTQVSHFYIWEFWVYNYHWMEIVTLCSELISS